MNDSRILPPPAPGIDSRVVLAMGMQSAPGAYAVMLGSGMSRAANVPTAWDVVQDLIRRIAAGSGADLSGYEDAPEQWWEAQGHGEPRYDDLVGILASTEAARQRLLAEYFEPAPGNAGPVQPTEAHAGLARLVASGRVACDPDDEPRPAHRASPRSRRFPRLAPRSPRNSKKPPCSCSRRRRLTYCCESARTA
jgi:hypothetical protein